MFVVFPKITAWNAHGCCMENSVCNDEHMPHLITSLVYESTSSSMDCIITIIRQVAHLANNVCGHVILPSLHVMWITCSRWGHLDVVKYLVSEVHCDPNYKSMSGWTPLHNACLWAECCSGGVSELPVVSWLLSWHILYVDTKYKQ